MGERYYDSYIHKRKNEGEHGETTQRELGDHSIMLDGIME